MIDLTTARRRRIGRSTIYYKQAEIRALTLHTFFKFVWGAGWGVKKPFSELFVWVGVYRARRSEIQISIITGETTADQHAYSTVDRWNRAFGLNFENLA